MSKYLITGDHKWTDIDYIRKYLNTLPKGSKVYYGGHDTGVEYSITSYDIKCKCKKITIHNFYDKTIKYVEGDTRIECFRLLRMTMDIKPDIIVFFHNDFEQNVNISRTLDILSKKGYEIIIVKNIYY